MSTSMREALEQIAAVCADNAPGHCDKALALKFVADVARAALSSPRLDRAKADSAVDRAKIAQNIVIEWTGMFDPPPQFNIQQSVVLQELIADAIMRETR